MRKMVGKKLLKNILLYAKLAFKHYVAGSMVQRWKRTPSFTVYDEPWNCFINPRNKRTKRLKSHHVCFFQLLEFSRELTEIRGLSREL
jgi:hypothetical protein